MGTTTSLKSSDDERDAEAIGFNGIPYKWYGLHVLTAISCRKNDRGGGAAVIIKYKRTPNWALICLIAIAVTYALNAFYRAS